MALVLYHKEHKSTSLGSHGIMTPPGKTDNKQINTYLRMSARSRNMEKKKGSAMATGGLLKTCQEGLREEVALLGKK